MRVGYDEYYYCSKCARRIRRNGIEVRIAPNGASLCRCGQRLRTKARFKSSKILRE